MKKILKKVAVGFGVLILVLLLGLAGLYLAASGDYTLPKTVADDPKLPHITLDGVTFHAQAFGHPSAPVIIVVHGGPGNDYRYLLDAKALADQFRVVFYDQRGTGLSPSVPLEQLTLKNMLEDLNSIISHYSGNKPVRILGHSWGAMLASGYVGMYPDKVSHVILAEPGMLTKEAVNAYLKKFKMNFGFDAITALGWLWLQSRHVESDDEYAKDDYFFTNLVSLDEEGGPIADYYCTGKPPKGVFKTWRYNFASSRQIQGEAAGDPENIQLDLVKGVEKYKGKCLFMVGSCNTMIGEKFQRQFHTKYFPNADFAIIEGAGHLMYGEKPDQSIAVSRRFFSE